MWSSCLAQFSYPYNQHTANKLVCTYLIYKSNCSINMHNSYLLTLQRRMGPDSQPCTVLCYKFSQTTGLVRSFLHNTLCRRSHSLWWFLHFNFVQLKHNQFLYICTYIHTCVHTRAHAHTHTHTHTYMTHIAWIQRCVTKMIGCVTCHEFTNFTV